MLSGNLVFCISIYAPSYDQLIIAIPKYPIAPNSQLGSPYGDMNGWSVQKNHSNSGFNIYSNTALIGHNLYTSIDMPPRIELRNTKLGIPNNTINNSSNISIAVYDMGLIYH